MAKRKKKIEWDSYDLDLMVSISRCLESPLELREVLINLFYFHEHIIGYGYFVKSLRKLVAAEMVYLIEGRFTVNEKFMEEFKKYEIPKTTKEFRIWDTLRDLDKKYVLTEEDLQEYPGRIISIFEFEEGISKLYEFLNKYDPLKVIPRSIAGNQLLLQGYSNDPSYGFTKENPIKVGGYHLVGSQQIYDYFYSIEGYNTTPINYKYIGKAANIDTKNGIDGIGYILEYAVWYEGELEPQYLYFNIFDYDLELKAPMGFIIKGPCFY